MHARNWLTLGGVLGAVALAGCSDGGDPLSSDAAPISASVTSAPVCAVLDFEGAGLGYGSTFTTATLFGLNLSVTGQRFLPDAPAATPTLFDTDADGVTQGILDGDLRHSGPGALCAGCAGLSNILVLPDPRLPFTQHGDNPFGGTITFSGFSGGSFFVEDFVTVDHDPEEVAPGFQADGSNVAVTYSGAAADGSVRTGDPAAHTFASSITFVFGTVNPTTDLGSGGVDNIEICKKPSGARPRTPGFWKNHPESWPVQSIVIGGVSYPKATAIQLMKAPTAGDKTFNMFEQLVAAKLNVLNGAEGSCIATTIANADAWMATFGPVGSGVTASSDAWQSQGGGTLHTALDNYNNNGCS